ncbi:Pectin lyase fold/virulence factor [Phaffia rhodozyma]|uniref:galacturonan 1,4-alpha-galacturonidase n=1 Tax=Phaffia rhodozyma TaxID=264483 RepID=A0A0F7SFX2_PHARH|nr:Pectin lyase fold/virulence factor [Phaffia rhodozyma]
MTHPAVYSSILSIVLVAISGTQSTIASAIPDSSLFSPSSSSLQARNYNETNPISQSYDWLTLQYLQYGAQTEGLMSCVVPHSGGEKDDTPNLMGTVASCGIQDVEIVFAKNVTYNIYSPFQLANLSNVKISIEGNLQFSENRTLIQSQVANITASTKYGKAYMQFSGENVTIAGSKDSGSGWLDCHGQQWWDIESVNYTNSALSANRPQTMTFDVKSGALLDLKIYNNIAWNVKLLGSQNYVNNTFTYAVSNSTGYPFNTDGFNIGAEDVLIENSVVYGGDDCVAIASGSSNIVFRDAFCRGTHGLSIGSLGSGGAVSTVDGVLIKDVKIEKSAYGARFKSWVGGRGYAKNITWENIEARQVIQPIFITTSYYDQQVGPPTDPGNSSTEIIDFTFKNFWGDIDSFAPKLSDATCVTDPCWNYVEGADGSQVVILDLDKYKLVSGLTFENVGNFVATNRKTTSVICDPSQLNSTVVDGLGIVCQDGPLEST